jgi:hypothetical protein
MVGDTETTAKHPLEEDVTLGDGTVVRVTGLLAVRFRTDPDAVREFVEDTRRARKDDQESHR